MANQLVNQLSAPTFIAEDAEATKARMETTGKDEGQKQTISCFPTVLAPSPEKISLSTSLHMYNTLWKSETVT